MTDDRPAAELLAELRDPYHRTSPMPLPNYERVLERLARAERELAEVPDRLANAWADYRTRLARAEQALAARNSGSLELLAQAWDDGWSMGFTDHRVNFDRSDRWMENPFLVILRGQGAGS